MSTRLKVLILLALLAAAVALVPAVGGAAPGTPDAPIRLLAATFTPGRGETPPIPADLEATPPESGQDGYYIVQFTGPPELAAEREVEATGARLLGYLPEYAFKVRMTPEEASAVGSLDAVAWVGPFHPAYKIAPWSDDTAPGLYRITIEQGGDVPGSLRALAGAGVTVFRSSGSTALVEAPPGRLAAMARVLDVAWIEPYVLPKTDNDQAGGVIMGGSIAWGRGYDGSTQIVAVADTGLGNGTAAGAHPDLPASRITAIHDWPGVSSGGCYDAYPDGSQDVDSGHGTHTSLSAVGDGGPSGEGMGVAPAANLVFQSVEDYVVWKGFCKGYYGLPDAYYLLGLPLDLHDLYQQAYDDGARVHSNSWGSDAAGAYTQDSADTDDFVFTHPSFVVTFSAGNAGEDTTPADGVVDSGSIGSPATAKNVIAVGASEGARSDGFPCDTSLLYSSHDAYQSGTCSDQGGQNTLGTAGSRWGFTVPPLSTDVTAGDPEQMAPFSSRGPTDDGRIKPDVVAPGTWILSGYSSMYQEGYGGTVNPQNGLYQWDGWGLPYNQYYKYMGGTSMSNPLAAGAAAIVKDFYQKTDAHAASAALVKATLVNSARDLLDENNDGANDNDFPIPNVHEGWGIIDLDRATDGTASYVDAGTGLTTGDSTSLNYGVVAGGSLRITLAWSDAAADPAAATDLVNDLDLVVVAPNGTTTYYGNHFSGGWSTSGGTADRVNNLENVYIASAAAGTWTITVDAHNVPSGPQPYALVIRWGDTDPPVFSGIPSDSTVEATSASGATVTYTAPTATDAVDGSVSVSCDPTSGSTFALGTTTVDCTATDTHGNEATASFDVTVQDTTPPSFSGVPSNTTVEATSASGATVTYTAPTASDLVDGSVSVSCSPTSGSTFPITTTTVDCTATDTHGNEGTASFDVTVEDTTDPVISGVPSDITKEATGPSGATATYTTPTATDTVDGTVTVNCSPASGSTFPITTTTVDCTATDTHGNQATASFDVTVQDTTDPVIANVPNDITTEATGSSGAAVSYTGPTATDIVDGTVTVVCDPASGATFGLGTTGVDCTATDTHGNQATASFDVTVQDTTEPVIANVPNDITTTATEAAGAAVTFTTPTATDAVDGSVSVSCAPTSGSIFALGTTTVDCTATDTHGNQAAASFDVTITPPVCHGLVATLWGGPGADHLVGTDGPDVIVGFGGADVIDALGGNDVVCGGGGADQISAGGGRDKVWGQGGFDVITGGGKRDRLKGGGGDDMLFGDGGNDVLKGGAGFDTVDGGAGTSDECSGESLTACEFVL